MYVIHTCIHDVSIKKHPLLFSSISLSKMIDLHKKYFSRHSLAKSDVTHIKNYSYVFGQLIVIKRDVQAVSRRRYT